MLKEFFTKVLAGLPFLRKEGGIQVGLLLFLALTVLPLLVGGGPDLAVHRELLLTLAEARPHRLVHAWGGVFFLVGKSEFLKLLQDFSEFQLSRSYIFLELIASFYLGRDSFIPQDVLFA